MSNSEIFRANDLMAEIPDNLEPWKVLVAACHFGPAMGDCVSLDYTYRFDGESIYCIGVGPNKTDVCLDGDIDWNDPVQSLEQYAGVNGWLEVAKAAMHKNIAENI